MNPTTNKVFGFFAFTMLGFFVSGALSFLLVTDLEETSDVLVVETGTDSEATLYPGFASDDVVFTSGGIEGGVCSEDLFAVDFNDFDPKTSGIFSLVSEDGVIEVEDGSLVLTTEKERAVSKPGIVRFNLSEKLDQDFTVKVNLKDSEGDVEKVDVSMASLDVKVGDNLLSVGRQAGTGYNTVVAEYYDLADFAKVETAKASDMMLFDTVDAVTLVIEKSGTMLTASYEMIDGSSTQVLSVELSEDGDAEVFLGISTWEGSNSAKVMFNNFTIACK